MLSPLRRKFVLGDNLLYIKWINVHGCSWFYASCLIQTFHQEYFSSVLLQRGNLYIWIYLWGGGGCARYIGRRAGLKIKWKSLNFKSKLVKAQRSLYSDLIDLVINLPCWISWFYFEGNIITDSLTPLVLTQLSFLFAITQLISLVHLEKVDHRKLHMT